MDILITFATAAIAMDKGKHFIDNQWLVSTRNCFQLEKPMAR